jgi:hypothetical protein
MNRSEAEEIFRGRKTIFDNVESLLDKVRKSSNYDLADQGQLDLFGAGLEVEKATLKAYSGLIDVMEWVRHEMYSLGVPVTYTPLDELDMHKDLFCTHGVSDLFNFDKDMPNVVVADWITDITYHKSKKSGKPYAKIFTSLYGVDNYWYLWGRDYKELIPRVYVNEAYLFQISYRIGTPEFSRESINITYLNNVKDIDLEKEYKRAYNASKEVKMEDKPWMIKNRKKKL